MPEDFYQYPWIYYPDGTLDNRRAVWRPCLERLMMAIDDFLIHYRTYWTYGLIESSVRMDCTCNSWILISLDVGLFYMDHF